MGKYELTSECRELGGQKLYRIIAVRSFSNIKEGDKGGFVRSEENLSHDGDAWGMGNACVLDNALVEGNARIFGCAMVSDNAIIWENARVFGKAEVCEYAHVSGNAIVRGEASVSGHAKIRDRANVFQHAEIGDNAKVVDDAYVFGYAKVNGLAEISGHARVHGEAEVYGNAIVGFLADVFGDAKLSHDARIGAMGDYVTLNGFDVNGNCIIAFRDSNIGVRIKWGCFNGSVDEFLNMVEMTYGNRPLGLQYKAIVQIIRNKFLYEPKYISILKQVWEITN